MERGHYGAVPLDGPRCAFVAEWPGPGHDGNGVMRIAITESASPERREALQTIMTGGDTEEMATMGWIFSAMAPTKLETLYGPIRAEADVDVRRGHVVIDDVLEMRAEPIRTPVTGAEHRARIDLPNGFECRLAEMGGGTTRTSGEIELTENKDSYAQPARLHLGDKGAIETAAA